MAMIQKIKQIPLTVILSGIFVLLVLVVGAVADLAGTLTVLVVVALYVAVMRLGIYVIERFF